MAAREQLTREEAIQFLTMQRDLLEEAVKANDVKQYEAILLETGTKVGYAPAFRCLVKGLSPEESIRWGK